MTRWLIGPGLPRSGTTYLFDNLARPANARFFNLPRHKEVNWLFRGSQGLLEEEFPEAAPDRYTLDMSPSYSMLPDILWDRVRDLPIDGTVKFLFSLRHPVDQAFAHYLHDIKALVCHRWDEGLDYRFLDHFVMQRYFTPRGAVFRAIAERFGPDNVLFLNFHTMFDDPGSTGRKIAALLDVDTIVLTPRPIGAGGWLPHFVYGGAAGTSYLFGINLVEVPPRMLVMINGKASRIAEDVDRAEAARIMSGALSWQDNLGTGVVRALERYVFAEMLETYSALLGEPLARWSPRDLRAKTPPVPASLRRVCRSGALATRLAHGHDLASGSPAATAGHGVTG